MGTILDADNHKLAIIRNDGTIRSIRGVKLGRVSANDIYGSDGRKVGYIDTDSDVFDSAGHRIGEVRNTGDVYDIENHRIGKVVGTHMLLGGAALLLIIR